VRGSPGLVEAAAAAVVDEVELWLAGTWLDEDDVPADPPPEPLLELPLWCVGGLSLPASGSQYCEQAASPAAATAGTSAIAAIASRDAKRARVTGVFLADRLHGGLLSVALRVPIRRAGSGSLHTLTAMVARTAAGPERVALVHDFLLDLRGAERVFLEMCALWPDAPIFTAVYDEDGTEGRFADREVHASFLQRLRPSARTFRALLPFYPAAIESFDLSGFDLVVSSSSAWAHAVICDEDTLHVSYCHNPFRYAWNDRDRTLAARRDPVSRAALRSLFHRWRQWDWIAAQRVDHYIANSATTRRRIKAYFGRESRVVHPPVETDRFDPRTAAEGNGGDHYLVLSELMPHKRIDVAVEAFNTLRLPLVVAGDGPDMRRLRALAGPTVRFAGRVSDAEVAHLLETSRALVVTAIEEFGIAAVEAQAAGRPALSVGVGGALETVVDGVTGRLWQGGPAELAEAVRSFDVASVDPEACVRSAARFDRSVFHECLPREIARVLEREPARPPEHAQARPPRPAPRPALRFGRRGRTRPIR
jgi:glycosyltransferase involved in cell wall biosynthesis